MNALTPDDGSLDTSSLIAGSRVRPDPENPWIGLFSFSESIRDFFHGRDAESETLARMVGRKTLTVLYGESGLGKSSLLQAGLFPRLRAQAFLPVYIRLSYTELDPNLAEAKATIRKALELALSRGELEGPAETVEALAPRPEETFWDYLHRLREGDLRRPPGPDFEPGQPVGLVLAFDQFEEIFTLGQLGRRGQRRGPTFEFIQDLADCIENRLPARVKERLEQSAAAASAIGEDPHLSHQGRQPYRIILSLRKDFVAELDDLRDLMPTVMENRMLLRPLDGRQALDAVLIPGRKLVKPLVARRIVRFVANMKRSGPRLDGGGDDGDAGEERQLSELQVDPSLLSMVCRELNKKRQAQALPEITRELVEQGSHTILDDFYEDCFRDQPEPAVRHFVEDCLLNEEDRRKSIDLRLAETQLARKGVALPGAALDRLVQHRLLRVIEGADHGTAQLELTHDVLCHVVSSKRRERETREQQEKEAAEQLAAAKRQREEAEAREQEARERQAIAEERVTRLRRERRLGLALTAVLLAAAFAVTWSWVGMRRAQHELRKKDHDASMENVRRAEQKMKDALPLQTASSGADTTPLDPLGNVFALVHAARALRDYPPNRRAATLAGDLLAERNWCPPMSPPLGSDRHDLLLAAACSRDGRQLLAISENGRVLRWTLGAAGDNTRAEASPHGQDLELGALHSAAFSNDGRWLLTGAREKAGVQLWQWDEESKTFRPGNPASLPFYSGFRTAAWSADDQWLVIVPVGNMACGIFQQKLGDTVAGFSEVLGLPHPDRVTAAEFSADSKRLVTASFDGKARLWNVDNLREPFQELPPDTPNTNARRDRAATERLFHATFSPASTDGGERVATVSSEGTVRIWNVGSAKGGSVRLPFLGSRERCLRAVFSPDGRRLLTVTMRGVAQIWDATDFKALAEPMCHEDMVFFARFTPDNRCVLTGAGPVFNKMDALRLWDVRLPAPLSKESRHLRETTATSAPAWLAPLTEAITGIKLGATGYDYAPPLLTEVAANNEAAKKIRGAGSDDGYAALWRRFFSEPAAAAAGQ